MKKIFPAIVIIISLLVIFKIFPGHYPDFKKIYLSDDTVYTKDQFKNSGISYFKIKNSAYLSYKMNTIRGRMIDLKKKVEKISIIPKLKGDYCLQTKFFNTASGNLNFRIYHNKELILEKIIEGNKNFSFTTRLSLSEKDHFQIILRGRTKVIITNPIFYKETNVAERSYVFMICADTLRAQQLSVYGYSRDTSPNISRLLEDSVLFENAYAQSSWTLPSHMSLFTGLYEFNHGIRNDRTILSEKINYLVENVSDEFATRSFNGGAYISPVFGFCRGFDKYEVNKGDMVSNQASKNLFRAAIEDLKLYDFPKTFYFLHTYHIHSPYNPPIVNLNKINPDAKFKSLSAPTHGITEFKNKFKKLPDDMIQNYIDLYDAEIFTFDECLGEFIEYLKKEKIYDQSMIILFSDHGEEFLEHQAWEHTHSLYNELIKIPLIVKFPNNKFSNLKIKSPVGLIDIMPTVFSYYNIEFQQDNIDGINLLPVLEGSEGRDDLFSSITTSTYVPAIPYKVARIYQNEKIIYNLPYSKETYNYFNDQPPPLEKYEFYDLKKDPWELQNTYSHKKNSVEKHAAFFNEIIRKAKNKLKTQLKKVKLNEKTKESLKALGYL